jgi:GntR family transcriptional regulator
MSWELGSDRPIYAQLIEQIELKICAGVYPPGSRLPAVRELAREASVNPNTMQRALVRLEYDGLLYTHRTSGRFVTEDEKMVMQVKNRLVRDHTRDFLDKMLKLGFDHEEILAAVSAIMGGEK